MTPAARVQAAIDLLDAIIHAARSKGAPADRVLSEWFRANRYAGSKDRRAIRNMVYEACRACGPIPENGRAAMLRLAELHGGIADLFDGSQYGPQPVKDGDCAAQGGVAPDWLVRALCEAEVAEDVQHALLERAPLDIRVNALKANRADIELPLTGEFLPSAQGLRFEAGTSVESWHAYKEGLVEVQDLGSQLIVEALPLQPGMVVVDLCAGAGGKTLALAARLQNQGELVAADTDKRRLGNLAPRAARAGALIADTILLDPGRELAALAPYEGRCDHVLVDAPCSGNGTWRRNPEARWRYDPSGLAQLNALQDHVLDVAAALVRPGGTIGFVTCSLLDAEGPQRVHAFLQRHPGWQTAPISLAAPTIARGGGQRLDPLNTRSDGFYVALLEAPC